MEEDQVKIVIAPDSFKGSLSAHEAALAIEEGILRADSSIRTVLIPMADGGEGTVESLVHTTKGFIQEVPVQDPLGREILAKYGILGDHETCVIEVASASGLPLLSKQEWNPLRTSSYGTGQLIRHALDLGFRKFIIGLGGSATNDAGAGILQALGMRLLDENGYELPWGGGHLHLLANLELNSFDERIKESEFRVACDVDNPLIGKGGASFVFGPQKGATAEMVERLDLDLTHFADVVHRQTGIAMHDWPGSGAAGGIGGTFLAFFSGIFEKGIDIVIKATELEKEIGNASLVITGEGQIDFQTKHGKTPSGVAKMANKHGVPTIAIVGSVGSGIDTLREIGIESVISMVNKPMELAEAMENSYNLLSSVSEQLIRVYLLGRKK